MRELPCDCCTGVDVVTPESTTNAPGLAALRTRVGTHGSFLATMLARLASPEFPGLARLRTRERDDPAIALLDAWASMADVLTFYQERLANESYLRTATDLRAVYELARLVGYQPRPGVAAATHLAFEMEKDHDEVLPIGTKAQSMPGPGELPQVFETSEPLAARFVFNNMAIRKTRPQVLTPSTVARMRQLWLQGTATGLQPNDAIAFVFAGGRERRLRLVARVVEDFDLGHTLVELQGGDRERSAEKFVRYKTIDQLIQAVASPKPVAKRALVAAPVNTDAQLRLHQVLRPDLASVLYRGWAGASPTREPQDVSVFAFRVRAGLFGTNASKVPPESTAEEEVDFGASPPEWKLDERDGVLYLDAAYEKVQRGTLVAVRRGDATDIFQDGRSTIEANVVARAHYGLSGKVTRLLIDGWRKPATWEELRETVVYTQSEELAVAEEPIVDHVAGAVLELDGLYEGLLPGRKVIVAGQRSDVPGVHSVDDAELVTVAAAYQGAGARDRMRRGDPNHTFVLLRGSGLAHPYRRGTVRVYGNVVHATHGETRAEVLGGGDGTIAHQTFALRNKPLTFVSAPTPSGIRSSLEVRVDDVLWPERQWFTGLGDHEPGYVARVDDTGTTVVTGPNGIEGRRFPTGSENLRARLRVGIGRPGNLAPTRVSQLLDKPLGAKGVTNPLVASGGADPETRDQARVSAPLPIRSLERLVSLVDYADFSRTFGGVGAAAADRLIDAHGSVVVVTVAGVDGTLLAPESDVIVNLRKALRAWGDPLLRLRVLPVDRLVLRAALSVGIDSRYEWPEVERRVRTALLARFSFEHQPIGVSVHESAIVGCVVGVDGVVWAHLDDVGAGLTGTPDPSAPPPRRRVLAHAARADAATQATLPGQQLYFAGEIPEMLVLTEVRR